MALGAGGASAVGAEEGWAAMAAVGAEALASEVAVMAGDGVAEDDVTGGDVAGTDFSDSLGGVAAEAICTFAVARGASGIGADEAIGGWTTSVVAAVGAGTGLSGRRACDPTSIRRASSRVRQYPAA